MTMFSQVNGVFICLYVTVVQIRLRSKGNYCVNRIPVTYFFIN